MTRLQKILKKKILNNRIYKYSKKFFCEPGFDFRRYRTVQKLRAIKLNSPYYEKLDVWRR